MKKFWNIVRTILAFPIFLIGFIIVLPASIVLAIGLCIAEVAGAIKGTRRDKKSTENLIASARKLLDTLEKDIEE